MCPLMGQVSLHRPYVSNVFSHDITYTVNKYAKLLVPPKEYMYLTILYVGPCFECVFRVGLYYIGLSTLNEMHLYWISILKVFNN